jgi:hypothetical protein
MLGARAAGAGLAAGAGCAWGTGAGETSGGTASAAGAGDGGEDGVAHAWSSAITNSTATFEVRFKWASSREPGAASLAHNRGWPAVPEHCAEKAAMVRTAQIHRRIDGIDRNDLEHGSTILRPEQRAKV